RPSTAAQWSRRRTGAGGARSRAPAGVPVARGAGVLHRSLDLAPRLAVRPAGARLGVAAGAVFGVGRAAGGARGGPRLPCRDRVGSVVRRGPTGRGRGTAIWQAGTGQNS